MPQSDTAWISGEYHIPLHYSCRIPMTSPYSGRALPAPGPATVQLALIRVGVELYGLDYVRNTLLPAITASTPLIRPPDAIAMTNHSLKVFKTSATGISEEGIAYREHAHACGKLTIYLCVPQRLFDTFGNLLKGIGYFGQTNSFVTCMGVRNTTPEPGSYAQPLETMRTGVPIGQYFTSFVTELRDSAVTWAELNAVSGEERSSALRVKLYVWPLTTCEHAGAGRRLLFCSLL